MPEQQTVWQPQEGPQHLLIICPIQEIMFGGARGGGKSDGLLGKFGIKQQQITNLGYKYNAIIFRKEMPQADDLIERSHEIYKPLGGVFNKNQDLWRFPNGARIRFRPLETIEDAAKYQGQNVSDVGIEEAGNYPDPAPIDRLWGAIRGNPHTQMIMTANPGGPGQLWLKARFYDPCPKGNTPLHIRQPNGEFIKRIYLPSKVHDNKILLQNDPDYVTRLYRVGSKKLVDAWLDGDWTAIEGAYFDCWSAKRHVIEPFEVPLSWRRFRSMDWGSASPFSVGWWTIVPDDCTINGKDFPRGAMIRYREWYGSRKNKPNTGLKLTAEQVAEGILDRELPGEVVHRGVLDPAAFAEDGGPSIAHRLAKAGVPFKKADNKRTARNGAGGGWDALRQKFIGEGPKGPGGADDFSLKVPMIYTFHTCKDSIRTIPVLQHDFKKPEDLDTEAEDHAADEWRYAVMANVKPRHVEPEETDILKNYIPPSFEELRLENVMMEAKARRL